MSGTQDDTSFMGKLDVKKEFNKSEPEQKQSVSNIESEAVANIEANETTKTQDLFDGVFFIPICLPQGATLINSNVIPIPKGAKYVFLQPKTWNGK